MSEAPVKLRVCTPFGVVIHLEVWDREASVRDMALLEMLHYRRSGVLTKRLRARLFKDLLREIIEARLLLRSSAKARRGYRGARLRRRVDRLFRDMIALGQ